MISWKWVFIGALAAFAGNYFFNFPSAKGHGDDS